MKVKYKVLLTLSLILFGALAHVNTNDYIIKQVWLYEGQGSDGRLSDFIIFDYLDLQGRNIYQKDKKKIATIQICLGYYLIIRNTENGKLARYFVKRH